MCPWFARVFWYHHPERENAACTVDDPGKPTKSWLFGERNQHFQHLKRLEVGVFLRYLQCQNSRIVFPFQPRDHAFTEGFWISYVDDGHEWDPCEQAPPAKKSEGDGFIEDGHQLLVGLYDPQLPI